MSEMKKRLQRKGTRKGFTLVELLIVIIIIGILAGAMMLVAGTSRDAAEASKIISDLRSVKSAALIWLTENPTIPNNTWDELESNPSLINAYLDRPLITGHPFLFELGDLIVEKIEIPGDPNANPPTETTTEPVTDTVWLVGYKLDGVRNGVKTNLEKQAKSVGLYGSDEIDLTNPDDPGYYKIANDTVYVIVQ